MKRKLLKLSLLFAVLLLSVNISTGQNNFIINEFMANNSSTIADNNGEYSDWIEIKNIGSETDSLSGWYLSDARSDSFKWAFPNMKLAPDEIIIVYASGKSNIDINKPLHTNFKLSSSGETLLLVNGNNGTYASSFLPFPEQYTDVSYGKLGDEYVYFSTPTPDGENTESAFIKSPEFSIGHGFFDEPFSLTLSCNLPDAEIYYTTDASTPDKTNGIKYTAPINITTTTVVRAIAVKDGLTSSITNTQTYIFPDDVINQPPDPPGYPIEWLAAENGTGIHYPWPSDYAMSDSILEDPEVSSVIIESLKELPVVSIVSDIDNFFSKSEDPDSGGIYMYTGSSNGFTRDLLYHLGRGWERPGSVEYFNDSKTDFQANCALKIHGGASRTRQKTNKHSFKIGFKGKYGPTRLKEKIFDKGSAEEFDWLILRGGFATRYGIQLRDPYGKSTFRDMGHYVAYSKFVHVYLNGLYWGMYNLSEQMDENTMREYFGGQSGDYDFLKDYFEVEAGDTILWSKLFSFSEDSIQKKENYMRLLGKNADGTPNATYEKLLDPENLIDYMLLNYYLGNTDWDHHNWMASISKVNPDGFKFFPWDLENTLKSLYENTTGIWNYNRPTSLFRNLRENEEFSNLIISRINTFFFNDGALTPVKCRTRYDNWLNIIDTAIVSESVRWNDSNEKKSDVWEKSAHTFRKTYFEKRTEKVFSELIGKQMYPSIDEPEFNTFNTTLPNNFDLLITAPSGGDIYYTTDGSDPGHISENSGSLMIFDGNALNYQDEIVNITARVKKDSLWSNVISKEFVFGDPVSVNPVLTDNFYFYTYPNPVTDNVNITFLLNQPSEIQLKLYSVTGNLVHSISKETLNEGEHIINWNAENVSPGIYICVMENNTTSQNYKTMIIKK